MKDSCVLLNRLFIPAIANSISGSFDEIVLMDLICHSEENNLDRALELAYIILVF